MYMSGCPLLLSRQTYLFRNKSKQSFIGSTLLGASQTLVHRHVLVQHKSIHTVQVQNKITEQTRSGAEQANKGQIRPEAAQAAVEQKSVETANVAVKHVQRQGRLL